MRVLAFDTATATCSAAVVTDDSQAVEITHHDGPTHARQLLVLAQTVLRRAGVGVDDLDGVAVTVGPGSFTGLRIGVSTAQGLALATGKPAVGISSLEALARQAGGYGLRCALLDARRKEVYAAAYNRSGDGLAIAAKECVIALDTLMTRLPAGCLYIGNGAVHYREAILARDPEAVFPESEDANHISAVTVGTMALEVMHSAGGGAVPLPIPRYIRKSDAERSRLVDEGGRSRRLP